MENIESWMSYGAGKLLYYLLVLSKMPRNFLFIMVADLMLVWDKLDVLAVQFSERDLNNLVWDLNLS